VAGPWPTAFKKALLYHWNLLFVGASAALAAVSGRPDVVLPLAGAAEIAYLAVLSTNTRFQKLATALDGHAKSPENEALGGPSEETVRTLAPTDQAQYVELAERCTRLRRLAVGNAGEELLGIPDLQLQNIDRLLRIYARLLRVKGTLERFFAAVNETELRRDLERAQARLAGLESAGEDPARNAQSRAAVSDTIATIEARMKNHTQARQNHEYVLLELERLHTKISGIAEMGIDRQDAASVGREIELVTSSVEETEQTMRKIEGLAGVTFGEENPPDPGGLSLRRRRVRN
jgi:hypothetical protein